MCVESGGVRRCEWILMDMLVLLLWEYKRGVFNAHRFIQAGVSICASSVLPLSYTLRPDGSQCSHEMSLFLGQQGSFSKSDIF